MKLWCLVECVDRHRHKENERTRKNSIGSFHWSVVNRTKQMSTVVDRAEEIESLIDMSRLGSCSKEKKCQRISFNQTDCRNSFQIFYSSSLIKEILEGHKKKKNQGFRIKNHFEYQETNKNIFFCFSSLVSLRQSSSLGYCSFGSNRFEKDYRMLLFCYKTTDKYHLIVSKLIKTMNNRKKRECRRVFFHCMGAIITFERDRMT